MIQFMKYVGVEYGEGPGQHKCWSLIRWVYKDELGIDLKDYKGVEDDIADKLRVAREMKRDYQVYPWTQVPVPRDFDVVVMAGHMLREGIAHRAPLHAGVMLAGKLLHLEGNSNSVWVSLGHPSVSRRIIAFCRHEQMLVKGREARA